MAGDTTIGQKKLIRLASPVTTNQVRLRITGSRAAPAIAELGLFRRPAGSSSSGTIGSAASGRCVDVNGGTTTNSTQLQLWDCNGNSNQRWSMH